MGNSIHKDDLRNTGEPYLLPLNAHLLISDIELKAHIDADTRTFKRWHLERLKLVDVKGDSVRVYENSNGVISFRLTLQKQENKLSVICDCDRKVEMLCHHAYTALKTMAVANNGNLLRLFTQKC